MSKDHAQNVSSWCMTVSHVFRKPQLMSSMKTHNINVNSQTSKWKNMVDVNINQSGLPSIFMLLNLSLL